MEEYIIKESICSVEECLEHHRHLLGFPDMRRQFVGITSLWCYDAFDTHQTPGFRMCGFLMEIFLQKIGSPFCINEFKLWFEGNFLKSYCQYSST